MKASPSLLVVVVAIAVVAAVASPSPSPLIPFDPSLEVASHAFTHNDNNEAHNRLEIFPRHDVPQIVGIHEPRALLLAVTIRELDLLPGDRLVVRDASNDTMLEVTSANQSTTKCALQRPRRSLWNRPLLTVGNRVTIEYWPSLRTLVLPIDRPQRDNAVVVLDAYSFAFSRRRRPTTTGREDEDETTALESQVGETNEMRPAVCFKTAKPLWYNKARSVARLMIERRDTATEATGFSGAMDSPTADLPTHNASSWTLCTGWLVGRGNHVLTNYHCLFELSRRSPLLQSTTPRLRSTLSPCATANNSATRSTPATPSVFRRTPVNVNFMAEAATCSATKRVGERLGGIDATTVEILVANEALDYCLLRIVPTANGSSVEDLARKYGYLTMRATGPVDGEPIYIPQHPNGAPKTIASTKDGKPAVIYVPPANSSRQASDDDAISVRYNADTAPGSSGSPVLSQRDNTVIALHHAGTGMRPRGSMSSGWWFSRIVDRVRGRSDDGDDATEETEWNVGIRIDAIVADLRQRRLLPPCAVAQKCGDATSRTRSQATALCCDATW